MMADLVVLLVAEEPESTRSVRIAFNQLGVELYECRRARDAGSLIESKHPALVLLDLRVPGTTGVEATALLREFTTAPLLAFSDVTEEQAKISVLDAGADDYLTVPLSRGEMLARARALLRRTHHFESGSAEALFRLGSLEVDFVARDVRVRGKSIHLTPTEYRLLGVLIAAAGRVVTHKALLSEVWGPSAVDQVQYLRVYMKQLRQKLERAPSEPRFLVTEPAVGYRLRMPILDFERDRSERRSSRVPA
jgi:two-component system KDP operon response regulator KdpE